MTTRDGRRGDVAVLVPAAGAGVRLGPGQPKALRLLGGEPLLVHAVRRLVGASDVGCVVVATPPGAEATVRQLLAELCAGVNARRGDTPGVQLVVVAGGEQRQQSVAAALAAVPPGFDIVLVHDAARALTPVSIVEDVVAAVRAGHQAVIPVLPVTDTITEVDSSGGLAGALDRSTLRAVQTPQGFRRAVLEAAHTAGRTAAQAGADGAGATDDAGLVARLGIRVHTIPGSDQALKITDPYDLVLAEHIRGQAG